jgi:hypothetical protein
MSAITRRQTFESRSPFSARNGGSACRSLSASFSLLGALYLRTRVKGVRDGQHGFVWCFGASLARLLPVIEINKEFTDFFDDPERKRLTGWQSFVFSAMGIVGWLLAAILAVAVSGLTQSS